MITGLLFLRAFLQTIAILASKLSMERLQQPRFRYSEIKPVMRYARQHWSIPDQHMPWRGYEDKTQDKRLQLRAVRRQVLNSATYFMEHGETPTGVVDMLNHMFFGDKTEK